MLTLRLRARIVDVDIESDARVLCLFGPSGSGKTTCLEAVAGLLRPEDGLIRIDGSVLFGGGVDLPPRRRGVGYLPQDAPLFPHLDVRGNLAYGAQGADPAPVAESLGIAALLDRPSSALSGGERRRVALGRALLVGPRILLLDEPFSGLDAHLRARLLARVARLDVPRVILVTHDPRDAMGLADEVVVLDRGRVALRGAPDRVFGPGSDLLEPSALLRGVVREVFEPYADVEAEGATLHAHLPGARVGEEVRLQLRAHEVTLALARHGDLSARNQVDAMVEGVESSREQLLVVLGGGIRILALVDPRSVAALGIGPGSRVVAQFKASSLRRAGS